MKRKAIKPEYIREHNLKHVEMYIIRMSDPVQKKLNYASKFNRDKKYIDSLISDGMEQAELFLASPEEMRYAEE